MNKAQILGRLTKDAELRTTTSGKQRASFTIAVSRNYTNQNGEKETDYINCIAFDKKAEIIAKYTHKGTQILIDGTIRTRNYDAQDGTKRYVTEVLVENLYLLGSKENKEEPKQETNDVFNDDAFGFKSIDMSFLSSFSSPSSSSSKGSNNISMADAFKELISSGGKYGIHFVISLDNLSSMRSFVTEFSNTKNKLFIKGVNQSTVSYLNADMRTINSLSNHKIGLLNQGDENTKVKLLRYYSDKNYFDDYQIGILKRLQEKVIKFCIVTGRSVFFFEQFPRLMEVVDYIIGSNGAFIYDVKNKDYVHKGIIDNDDFMKLVKYSVDNKFSFLLDCVEEKYYYDSTDGIKLCGLSP